MATDHQRKSKRPLVALLGLALVAGVLAGGFWLGARGGDDTAAEVGAPPAAPVTEADAPERASGEAPAAPANAVADDGAAVADEVGSVDAAPAAEDVVPEERYEPTWAETEPAGLRAAEAGTIGQPALVMFHADWCHVCQQIMPTVTEMREEYKGTVAILKMNVDHPETAAANQTYRVRGTPTFVLFDRHGNVATQFSGWPGEGRVAQALDQVAAVQ